MTRVSKPANEPTGVCAKHAKCGSKQSIGPSSSLATLQKLASDKKKQYLHSNNTTEKYDGYVARGKEWLAFFSEEEQEAESKWKSASLWGLSSEGEDEIAENKMEESAQETPFILLFHILADEAWWHLDL